MRRNPDDANSTLFAIATNKLNKAPEHNISATHQAGVDTCVLRHKQGEEERLWRGTKPVRLRLTEAP